jgi:hypothetical protein
LMRENHYRYAAFDLCEIQKHLPSRDEGQEWTVTNEKARRCGRAFQKEN